MATPPSRSPHSLFTAPDRLLKSGQTTVRPLAGTAMASRVPTAPRGLTGWRGASFPRLLLIGSCSLSSRENRSPSTLLQPPTPKPPGRDGQWGSGEMPGSGRLGGVVGECAANGRAPHIPAQQRRPRPPASRRVAPRATPGYPGAGAQPKQKVRGKWQTRKPARQPSRRVLPTCTLARPRWGWLPSAIAECEDPPRELPAWFLRMRSPRCMDLLKGT